MRAIILVLAILFAAAMAQAQEQLAPNPAIEATIQNQFDAFRLGDVDTAWQYASPSIQGMFRTPENFGRMVEQGYPMVWSPGEVTFMDLQSLGSVIVQRVEVIDLSGAMHILGYSMIETAAGWQINGVQILRAPDVGA
ncbi:MAG: DUF4864 domain-containing protein [Pseudomonadota bacterium]